MAYQINLNFEGQDYEVAVDDFETANLLLNDLKMEPPDEEDVFPSEGRAESNHFTSRTPNPDNDAMQENMKISDSQMKILGTFGFPVVRSPCDLKDAANNTNESSIDQIEDDDNTKMVSDEGDSKDVISSISISRVETVVDANATSPISSTSFVEHGTRTKTPMDFDNREYSGSPPISNKADEESDKETPTAATFPIFSNSLVGLEADLETMIDSDSSKSHISDESNLGSYTRLHTVHNGPVYRCQKCDYKSTNLKFLKHLKTVHKIESKTKTKNLKKCDFCSYTTRTKQRLERHRQLHIVKNRPMVSCTKCDYKAPRVAIFRHYKKVHGSRMNEKEKAQLVYTCKFCSHTTKKGNDLEKHLLHTVHNRAVYRCRKCDYKSTKINFSKHVITAHKIGSKAKTERLKKCDCCSYTTKDNQQFENHRQRHIVGKKPIVSCTKCDYKAFSLFRHYKNVHGLQKCKFCSYTAKKEITLEKHLLLHTVHNGPVYHCPKCDYKSTKINFTKHVKTAHKIGSKAKTETLKKCDCCSYTTKVNQQFENHRQRHVIGKKPIVSCTKCDYKEFNLFRHYKNVHGLQKCKFCSHTTKTGTPLEKHLLLHTVRNRPVYRCRKCDYKSTKINFSKHVKTAHKIGSKAKTEGLRKCDCCSYTTKDNQQFENHRQRHIVGKKPIVSCTKCDYKEFNLFRHYKNVHGLQKCKFCSHTTNTGTPLEKHLLLHTVHNRPVYHCPKCDYKSTKINFTKHVKTAHKIGSKAKTEILKKCDCCSYTTKDNQQLENPRQRYILRKRPTSGFPVVVRSPCDLKDATNNTNESSINQIEDDDNIEVISRGETVVDDHDYCKSNAKATSPVSPSSFVEHETKAETAMDFDNREYDNGSPNSNTMDEESGKETPTAETFLITSNSLVGQEAGLEASIDLDKCENYSTFSPKSERKVEESGKENFTTVVKNRVHSTNAPSESQGESSVQFEANNSCDLSRQSEASEEQSGILKKSKQHGEINGRRFKHLHRRYRCEFCSYSTKRKSSLKGHIIHVHTVNNLPIYRCSECDYKSNIGNLTRHMMTAHRLSAETQPLKSCNFCSYTTKQEVNMEKHLLLHTVHNTPLYNCPKCDYKSTNRNFVNHLKSVHKIKSNYICSLMKTEGLMKFDFCSYTTKSNQDLINHRQRENQSVFPPIRYKKDEESEKENSTAAALPIACSFLVGQRANTATAIDLDNSKSHNVSLIKDEEGEDCDRETPVAANFPYPSSSLDRQKADLETLIDLNKCENHRVLSVKSEREDGQIDSDLDGSENHNVSLTEEEEDEESGKGTPAAANFPFSSSSLIGQEADLETFDLDMCENHSVFSPKSEREDEESDTENSSGTLVGQEAYTAMAIDLDDSENHNVSLIKEEEDEENAKETPAVAIFAFSSSSLVGQDPDLETSIDLDTCENHSVFSPKSEREDEESDTENSTAATLPISSSTLVGQEPYTAMVIDLDNSKSHNDSLIKDEEDEQTDLKSPVNATDDPSESPGERQFEASRCDTTTSQKYQHKPVISDRTTFKCKLCSYSSTIRFGLKKHMLAHSEYLNLNKIKCELCPFKAKSKKRLANHLLVRHKNEKRKCTTCNTFVPARLKGKHLLKCKANFVFECEECQYKTIYEGIFVRHQMKCRNRRRSIPRQLGASGGQCGKLEKNKQRGEINERSQPLHRCEYCSYSTKERRRLKNHILAHTVYNGRIYRCSECDYKSTSPNLIRHMMIAHSLSAETQLLKSCDFCSYITRDKRRLEQHLILHTVHNRLIYQCRKCDFKSTKYNLARHVKVVHEPKFENASLSTKIQQLKSCNFCSYSTDNKGSLKAHLLLHTVHNKPIYQCPKCDYKSVKMNLAKHVKTVHKIESTKDVTEGRCKFCSFTTRSICSLKKHTRLHTVYSRPTYQCPKCDYKSTKRDFYKHVRTAHKIESKNIRSLGSKMLKCDSCSYTTIYNGTMVRHLQVHILRNRPIVSCTKCDYKAPQITVTRHYKNVHAPPKDNAGQLTETEYTCKFCSFTTQDKRTLRTHTPLHTVHNRPIYRCSKCDYKSTKLSLARHVKDVHSQN